MKRFESISPSDLIDYIVDLRGRLHHHSVKDKRQPWHPEEQDKYHADAIMLANVAHAVMWKFVKGYLYDVSVLAAYDALRASGSNNRIT